MTGSLQTALPRSCLVASLLLLTGFPSFGQSSTNLRILPLGDSITHGTESTSLDGYRGPLAVALSSQVAALNFVGTQISGTMSDPDNEGHPSYKVSDIAALANASLNNYKPNVVLLDAGINDLEQTTTSPLLLRGLVRSSIRSWLPSRTRPCWWRH